MSDKQPTHPGKPDERPIELVNYIETAKQTNDALILEAIAKLEDPKTRGKHKPTVASIQKLTGLSRNTIRGRSWALTRLKAIKRRGKSESEGAKATAQKQEDEGAILEKLRKRIKHILEQNSLFYEEILSLHRIIATKDVEIERLKTSVEELKLRKPKLV